MRLDLQHLRPVPLTNSYLSVSMADEASDTLLALPDEAAFLP